MNKRFIFGAMLLASAALANADVIVKKDGTTMTVYNIEVGAKFITYTKAESLDSELGRVNKEECFAIKTDKGEMVAIDAQSGQQLASQQSSGNQKK